MPDFLFVTWDGGGNLPPALGIAGELRKRGHSVAFLGHRQQRAAIHGAGFGFTGYAHARPWSSAEPANPARIVAMFTDAGPGIDLLHAVDREPAAVVVIDCLSLGALRAAGRAGLRRAVLAHTYYRYLAHSWSRGPIGWAGRLKGQNPVRLWESADLILVAAHRDLDPAADGELPATLAHTGAVLPAPQPPARARAARPRVLVSLSTTWFPRQERALQAVIDALSELPVDVIVTTGPAIDPARLRAAANAELHRYLPHAQVMPTVSLVIGHGGHATTMRALAHDLPVVVLPMHPMLDQQMIGDSVASRGAGAVLSPRSRAAQIVAAASKLLGPGPHTSAAARIGAALRAEDGAARAADRLTALLHAAPAAANGGASHPIAIARASRGGGTRPRRQPGLPGQDGAGEAAAKRFGLHQTEHQAGGHA